MLLASRNKTLNKVIKKNKILVESVPDNIAQEDIKKEFL